MKKDFKYIFCFFLGFVVSLFGTTYAASQILASDVNFTPRDSSWNVDNTEAAINDLYSIIPGVPTGTILAIMGNNAPAGYVICDGTEYNISSHVKLANYIKQEFGSYNYFGGDGETTFAVPDLRGEFLRGAGTNSTTNLSGENVGSHQSQGLPNITGTFSTINHIVRVEGSGAFSVSASYEYSGTGSGGNFGNRGTATYSFSAAKSNSLYGKSDDVRASNTSVLYVIKY